MWRKRVLGGLFLMACLMMMAKSQAWQEDPPAKQKFETEIKSRERRAKEAQKSTDASLPTSLTPLPGSLVSPAPAPDTVTDLLARLVKIKEQRANLDKEEQSIVETIKAQLNDQRQRIDTAEQELRKLAPHAFAERTGLVGGSIADGLGTPPITSPPSPRQVDVPRLLGSRSIGP